MKIVIKIIIIILFIYYMLFLQRQGAHSLLQAHGYKLCTETLLQKHCCNTLLQNIITVTEHWHNITKRPTHPTTPLIKDWGAQITTDKFKKLVGKTEKVLVRWGQREGEKMDTLLNTKTRHYGDKDNENSDEDNGYNDDYNEGSEKDKIQRKLHGR